MNLLQTWWLVSNVTNPSCLEKNQISVCADRDKSCFDSDACFADQLGTTKAQLRETVFNATAGADDSSAAAGCDSTFYLFGFDELEARYPGNLSFNLAECGISTYAAALHAAALRAPCRTTNLDAAKVLMVPPYTAWECNWPAYAGEYCYGPTNMFRTGMRCAENVTNMTVQLREQYPGKFVLLVEKTEEKDDDEGMRVYEGTVENTRKDPGLIFARVQSMSRGTYRPGIDVSFPPAPFSRVRRTPPRAFEEPVQSKRYFASFKGQMKTDVRVNYRNSFHNGKDIIIEESYDEAHDFDDLLYNSKFNLILRGDLEFSFRFNEAVCSGGVPVLITTRWVPPFNEIVPFDTYGVYMKERAAKKPMDLLRAIPDTELERKRAKARLVCEGLLQSVDLQVQALLRFILERSPEVLSAAGDGKAP